MPGYKGPLSNKHIDQNASTNPNVVLPLVGFVAMTAVIIFRDEEKRTLLISLLRNKQFMITLLGIIAFSTWQLNAKDEDDPETDRRKRATREAILGLIIAILAYLDLKAAPFFIIWIVSYYLDK